MKLHIRFSHPVSFLHHPATQKGMPPPRFSVLFLFTNVSLLLQFYTQAKSCKINFPSFFLQDHNSQTTPEKDFSQSIQSLHISSNNEHTETKSSEYICKEDERSEGSEPPKESPTSTAYISKSQNWALMIDWGARLVFPLSYSAFTIAYFVVII